MEVKEKFGFSNFLNNYEKLQNVFPEKKRKKINLCDQIYEKEVENHIKIKTNTKNKDFFCRTQTKCITNYNFPNNCTEVVSKSELLPKTPKIFNSKNICKKNNNILQPPFVFKLLTTKSTDLDIENRFITKYKNFNFIVEKSKINNKEGFGNKFKKIESKSKLKLIGLRKEKNVVALSKIKKNKFKKVNCESLKNNSSINIKKVDALKKSIIEEKSNSHADIYEIFNKRGVILHLHYPCKFSFYGELKFTLITGEVEILGFILNDFSNFKTIEIYSPQQCTPLIVQSNIVKKCTTTEEIKELLKNKLSENNIIQLLSSFQTNDSILLVEQINSTFGNIVDKFLNISLFPKELENFSSRSEWLKILQSSFNFTSSFMSNALKKSCEWDKISLSQCTVICGGKGVGKSTLSKYYVNKCLNQNEKILYLDFDPGQSEFTPPGFLSAVIIDKPFFGPNFTHLKDGKIMVYYGNVDVSQSPSKYLECVEFVLTWCRNNKEISEMKWLVNTMGFCKGLGVELMISILKFLKPTTVIQILSSDNLNNYPFYLTSATVNNEKGFRTKNSECSQLDFNLHVINSKAKWHKHQIQDRFSAKQLRNIITICYFSQMLLPPYYNFNAVKPYIISFSKIYLGMDFLISPNDILKAFNGSIVSLGHFEPTSEEILCSEKNDYFKIVIKPNVSSSVGLGFIRGIDCNKKKFYLITHLSLEKISNVNCLNLGRLSPPESFFLKQDTVERPVVYTSFSRSDIVQRVKRVFRFQLTQ